MAHHFIDAQQRHAQHPTTFDVPCVHELEHIAVGSLIKVGVELDTSSRHRVTGERFWLRVLARSGDTLTGVVDNKLVLTDAHGIKCGDHITVHTRHVLNALPSYPHRCVTH